jgi:hypothetical protein
LLSWSFPFLHDVFRPWRTWDWRESQPPLDLLLLPARSAASSPGTCSIIPPDLLLPTARSADSSRCSIPWGVVPRELGTRREKMRRRSSVNTIFEAYMKAPAGPRIWNWSAKTKAKAFSKTEEGEGRVFCWAAKVMSIGF